MFFTLSLLATLTPKHDIKTRYFNVAYIGLAQFLRVHEVLSLEIIAFLLIFSLSLFLLLGDTLSFETILIKKIVEEILRKEG